MHTPLLFIRSGSIACCCCCFYCFCVCYLFSPICPCFVIVFPILFCWSRVIVFFSTGLEDDKREEAKEKRDGKVDHDLVVLRLQEEEVLDEYVGR